MRSFMKLFMCFAILLFAIILGSHVKEYKMRAREKETERVYKEMKKRQYYDGQIALNARVK